MNTATAKPEAEPLFDVQVWNRAAGARYVHGSTAQGNVDTIALDPGGKKVARMKGTEINSALGYPGIVLLDAKGEKRIIGFRDGKLRLDEVPGAMKENQQPAAADFDKMTKAELAAFIEKRDGIAPSADANKETLLALAKNKPA